MHISSEQNLEQNLSKLLQNAPELKEIRAVCGDIPLRRGPEGFAGLAHIVIGQLLSVASAKVIHHRFCAVLEEVSAERFLRLPQEDVMKVGLTRAKYATLKGLAEAEIAGRLDYLRLGTLPAETAIAELCAYKGIGPWSAELYLLSAVGHPDVFPAGDLALQKATQWALQLDQKPTTVEMREIALRWTPYRAVAARLLWRYFSVKMKREGTDL